MGIASIYFTAGDMIRIFDTEYKVVGAIHLKDENKNKEWLEYYLDDVDSTKTMWLKVDNTIEEYILYSSPLPLTEGRRDLMARACYYKIDEGRAVVTRKEGEVYIGVGSFYDYELYKSSMQQEMKQIQRWLVQEEVVDCTVVDPIDIVRIDMQEVSVFAGTYDNTYHRKKQNLQPIEETQFQKDERKMHLVVGGILFIVWLIYKLL